MHFFCEWSQKLKQASHKVVPVADAHALLCSEVGRDIKTDEWSRSILYMHTY
jgi:hypothetical protein